MPACRLQDVTWRTPSRAEGIILRDLLDNNGCVTRDRLIQQLYGTPTSKDARNSLNVFLSRIRFKLKRKWTLNKEQGRDIILREEQTMLG